MIRIETIKLANGLELVMCEDKSKHSAYAELITKFGGFTKNFVIDNQEYHLVDGIAHLLEHTLIDSSSSGNLLKYFSDNYVAFNGVTFKFETSFYIDTVEDFENHLVTLITEINTPNFKEEDLDIIKKTIYEEIRRSDDRLYRKYHDVYIKAILPNSDFLSNVGTIKDVSEISYDLLKLCHDTFYHPSNQMILISGNFDIEQIKRLIEDTYNSLNKPKIEFTYLKEDNSQMLTNEEITVTGKEEDLVTITYKVDISKIKGIEGLKMSYYLRYFVKYNFDDTSKLFEDLVSKSYTVFSININIMKIHDSLFINFTCFTKEKDYFINKVKEIINNRQEIDEEKFISLHRQSIIDQILKEEECGKMLKSIYGNIVDHELYDPDRLEDVEKINIEEFKEYIQKLDFSSYLIVVQQQV